MKLNKLQDNLKLDWYTVYAWEYIIGRKNIPVDVSCFLPYSLCLFLPGCDSNVMLINEKHKLLSLVITFILKKLCVNVVRNGDVSACSCSSNQHFTIRYTKFSKVTKEWIRNNLVIEESLISTSLITGNWGLYSR